MRWNPKSEKEIRAAAEALPSSDPLVGMVALESEADSRKAALQWIALATLHAFRSNARKITIFQNRARAWVKAVYRPFGLPSPSTQVADEVFNLVDGMLPDGKAAPRIRVEVEGVDVDIEVRTSVEDGEKRVALKFPNMAKLTEADEDPGK